MSCPCPGGSGNTLYRSLKRQKESLGPKAYSRKRDRDANLKGNSSYSGATPNPLFPNPRFKTELGKEECSAPWTKLRHKDTAPNGDTQRSGFKAVLYSETVNLFLFSLKRVLTRTNNASQKQPAGRNGAQLVENNVANAVQQQCLNDSKNFLSRTKSTFSG